MIDDIDKKNILELKDDNARISLQDRIEGLFSLSYGNVMATNSLLDAAWDERSTSEFTEESTPQRRMHE